MLFISRSSALKAATVAMRAGKCAMFAVTFTMHRNGDAGYVVTMVARNGAALGLL